MIRQTKPLMISRASWNAKSATCSGSNTKEYLIIHHTGDKNDALSSQYLNDEKGFMKAIQDIHMNSGFSDIGYNYAIGLDGSILVGRDVNYTGGNCYNYNRKSIGVVVLGNYDLRTLTQAQEEALVKLSAWLCYTYNIPTTKIKRHSDLRSTGCPGSDISSKFTSIKNDVFETLHADFLPM